MSLPPRHRKSSPARRAHGQRQPLRALWLSASLPLLGLASVGWTQDAPVGRFTPEQRAGIVAFWNAPNRYTTQLPEEAGRSGPWQVRLTPEGSRWFLAYQRALGFSKLPPNSDLAMTPQGQLWEPWVRARLAHDRWMAQESADRANETLGLRVVPAELPPVPPPPGPIPADLLAAIGNPPALATAVTPMRYLVRFQDGETFDYETHIPVRERYAYYRFHNGVRQFGTRLKDTPQGEVDALFAAAGLTPSEERVCKAVSRLEGGFEAINTYDTGFVSVGFIQFITSEGGKGSLSKVLLREKSDRPADFERDFRAYGIDLAADGGVLVVDPRTGAELEGPAAVQALIEDKRLIAVFQRAGRHSTAFRVAQVLTAKSGYWPAEDMVKVKLGDQELTGKVSEVIRSEAGLATLFDRKVNRGNIQPFAEVVAKVMTDHQLSKLSDAARYEREIVAQLKYREDFLAEPTLSQPGATP